MEADASQSYADLKINSYSAEYKLEAIKFVEEGNSIHRASRKFNVDRKRIREWQRTKADLEATDHKRKRLEGGGRKPLDEEMEEVLLEWVHQRRSSGLRSFKNDCSQSASYSRAKMQDGTNSPLIYSKQWLCPKTCCQAQQLTTLVRNR